MRRSTTAIAAAVALVTGPAAAVSQAPVREDDLPAAAAAVRTVQEGMVERTFAITGRDSSQLAEAVAARLGVATGDRSEVTVRTWYSNGYPVNPLAFTDHEFVLERDRSAWRVVSRRVTWRS